MFAMVAQSAPALSTGGALSGRRLIDFIRASVYFE